MTVIEPKEGHIIYQKEKGWSWIAVETDDPDSVKQIPISALSQEFIWEAEPGYYFEEVDFLKSDNLQEHFSFKKVNISEEHMMTDFVEMKIKEEV